MVNQGNNILNYFFDNSKLLILDWSDEYSYINGEHKTRSVTPNESETSKQLYKIWKDVIITVLWLISTISIIKYSHASPQSKYSKRSIKFR